MSFTVCFLGNLTSYHTQYITMNSIHSQNLEWDNNLGHMHLYPLYVTCTCRLSVKGDFCGKCMHQTCFCLVTRSQSSDSHFFNSSGISTFTSLSGVGSRYTHVHILIHIVVEDTVGAAHTIELSATSCLPLFRRGVSVSGVTKDNRHTHIIPQYIYTCTYLSWLVPAFLDVFYYM